MLDNINIQNKLNDLLKEVPTSHHHVLGDMISNLIQFVQNTHSPSDLSMLKTTIRELRQAYKVFNNYKDFRKVCIFGSARTKPDNPDYIATEQLAKNLSQKGFMIITGAGGGIMEAGNKGAEVNMSFGLNIELPFEQEANPYIAQDSKLVHFKYFFNRKLIFIKESDATVLCPGGFGTHDEGFEVLTLIQTGRCAPRPIILFSQPDEDYWENWVDFIKDHLLKKHYISPDDMTLFTIIKDPLKATEHIENFYKNYHSIKYIQDMAIIRLKNELSKDHVARLNAEYKDLFRDGPMEQLLACDSPLAHQDYMELPRLVFRFNKVNFGRLTQLIYSINQ